jgi:molybdenum ABC transporter molybdate-binding protein
MKASKAIIIGVLAGWLLFGCDRISQNAAERINVVAPDYLAGILEPAAQEFTKENGTPVNIIYVEPDSVVERAKSRTRIDLFLKGNPRWMETLSRDTALTGGVYSCPFNLSLVVMGRIDGPAGEKIDNLKSDRFHRVVIIDPARGYEGQLAERILRRHHLWDKLQPRLILAQSRDQLHSFLTTKEADAAVVFESTVSDIKSLTVIDRMDKELEGRLIICGAVTSHSDRKKEAQAFLDLLDSRLCPIYKIGGVYQPDDRR